MLAEKAAAVEAAREKAAMEVAQARADAALLEFALRVLACFGFDDARARDAMAAVPGAFADPSASRRSNAS